MDQGSHARLIGRWCSWLGVALVVAVVACDSDVGPPEAVTRTSEAVTGNAPKAVSFDVVFPSGYGLSRVALGANDSVVLGPSDTIVAVDGSAGAVTNAGSDVLTAGPETNAGHLVSIGDIVVGPNPHVSQAVSAGRVITGPGASTVSVQEHATLTPLAHRTVTIHPPAGSAMSVTVAPGSTKTLPPGPYQQLTIGPKAVVTLTAGTYSVGDFVLGPGAELHLDTSGGSVEMLVNSSLSSKGMVTGDPTRFLVACVGANASIGGGFAGTVLAPNGTIDIAPSSTPYHGTFYGKHVTVGPKVTIDAIASPLLIDGISVSPTTLCPGQQAEVTLQVAANASTATPWIQGVVGSHQFVQFSGVPADRTVFATVFGSDGRADFVSVPVTLQQCTPTAPPVALHFWGARKLDSVDFSVSTYDASGLVVPMSGSAAYAWTFGDGQTATTTVPVVEHDYSAAIDHLAPYSYFHASVSVTTTAGTATAQKIVPIWSLYAANRAKGIVQPPSSFSATPSSFVLGVTNYEPTPLSITQANVDLVPCDPALDPQPQPSQSLSAVVPAFGTADVVVAPPPPAPGICTIAMHLLGTTAAGDVRTESYVRVHTLNPLRQLVADPATIALLNSASTMTANPNRFDENELQALVNRGALPGLPPPVPPGVVYANVGDECDPQDTPPSGMACEPTSDWVIEPPEMLNAFKGYFLMDHGCGSIGQLLSAVGQLYSHNSILTKNRVEVRHSTDAEDRVSADIDDKLFPPSTKLHPDNIQFGFPGTQGTQADPIGGPTATHSIDEMVHQYFLTDPEGRTWRMGTEFDPSQDNTCQGDITAVPPLVIRPDPGFPQPDLQGVVNQALETPSHYRFFMYSHADTPSDCTLPWCSGQTSTVCSLFARNSVVAAGLPLWPNGPLASRGGAYDGLNTYDVDTRTAGAHALFSMVHDNVVSQVHPWDGVAETVAAAWGQPWAALVTLGIVDLDATNIANQMVNCFATDGCGDNGDTWEESGVGNGIAVSPDDMAKQWPTQKFGGTYGYNEPAVYLATVYRHKYTLQPLTGNGAFKVVVEDEKSQGIPGVTVLLDSEVEGTTDASGTVQIGTVQAPTVPAGPHQIEAQQYTGPPLTPLNITPTADDILAMPECPAFPDCKASGCPSGWTTSKTSATVSGQLSDGTPDVSYYYACYPPIEPPPGCDLLNAARPATAIAGKSVDVLLTLCEGATCSNGVRAACQQNCDANNPCDNNLVCTNGQCVPPPRRVHITDPGIQGIVSGGCSCNTFENAFANLDIWCDPSAQPNLTDWLCDGGHLDFCTSPIIGGTADKTLFLNGNGDCNALQFHFVCTMDPLGTGGIIVGTDMRLLDGCGSGAEDEKTARQWITRLPPATWQDPSPAPASCTGDPSPPLCDQSGQPACTCEGFSSQACFHNFNGLACDDCCDNEADLGTAITYANVSK